MTLAGRTLAIRHNRCGEGRTPPGRLHAPSSIFVTGAAHLGIDGLVSSVWDSQRLPGLRLVRVNYGLRRCPQARLGNHGHLCSGAPGRGPAAGVASQIPGMPGICRSAGGLDGPSATCRLPGAGAHSSHLPAPDQIPVGPRPAAGRRPIPPVRAAGDADSRPAAVGRRQCRAAPFGPYRCIPAQMESAARTGPGGRRHHHRHHLGDRRFDAGQFPDPGCGHCNCFHIRFRASYALGHQASGRVLCCRGTQKGILKWR